MWLIRRVSVVLMGVWLTAPFAVRAQDTSAPLPLHPISTKPEGNAPGCSYSGGVVSGSGGATTTNSSTCPPAATLPPSYTNPDFTAMARQAEKDQQAADAKAKAEQQQKANQPAAPDASPSQKFAFPGEGEVQKVNDDGSVSAPERAAPANGTAGGPGLQDAGSSGSSSSRSSSSSSSSDGSVPDDAKAGDDSKTPGDAAPAPKRGRKKLPPVARQSPDERETEDVQVGRFYMNDSNWTAAYDRAKDAVSLADDDWEAHLLLADSARKLGKLDEAQKQYKRTLELDPIPKGKKAAQVALKEMGGVGGDTLMP